MFKLQHKHQPSKQRQQKQVQKHRPQKQKTRQYQRQHIIVNHHHPSHIQLPTATTTSSPFSPIAKQQQRTMSSTSLSKDKVKTTSLPTPNAFESVVVPIYEAYNQQIAQEQQQNQQQHDRPLRLLHLNCGDGKDTFFLAMFLHEALGESCEYELYTCEENRSMCKQFSKQLSSFQDDDYDDDNKNNNTDHLLVKQYLLQQTHGNDYWLNKVQTYTPSDYKYIVNNIKLPLNVSFLDDDNDSDNDDTENNDSDNNNNNKQKKLATMPYKNNFFDGIITILNDGFNNNNNKNNNNIFAQLQNDPQSLYNIQRVLTPNGYFAWCWNALRVKNNSITKTNNNQNINADGDSDDDEAHLDVVSKNTKWLIQINKIIQQHLSPPTTLTTSTDKKKAKENKKWMDLFLDQDFFSTKYGIEAPFQPFHSIFFNDMMNFAQGQDTRQHTGRWVHHDDVIDLMINHHGGGGGGGDNDDSLYQQMSAQVKTILNDETTPHRPVATGDNKEFFVSFETQVHFAQNTKGLGAAMQMHQQPQFY